MTYARDLLAHIARLEADAALIEADTAAGFLHVDLETCRLRRRIGAAS